MDKYQRGKVYAIVCNKTGRRYVGSTCEPKLARRLVEHVACFNYWIKNSNDTNKTRYKSSFDIIKDGDYFIILLESYPCNSRDELRMCEQKHIDLCECVNKVKAFQSAEERLKYLKQYLNQYHDKHSNEISIKNKERICCSHCQKEMNKSSLTKHKKICPKNLMKNQI